jgi:chromosome segregation ATPase
MSDANSSTSSADSSAGVAEQLRASRAAFGELEQKWTTAKSLLVEVNQQNKALRADVTSKAEKLKKLFDEFSAQKATIAQLEDLLAQAQQRNAAHEENEQRLQHMVEALGDAQSGLHGEQELRLAELQRTSERLMQEAAQRDDECRELQKHVDALRGASIELRAQTELRDAALAKLTQEKAFLASQLQVERDRASQLAHELDLQRARAVDAETRRPAPRGAASAGSLLEWWERVKADRTVSLYFGVFGVVFLMLLWYFLASRKTSGQSE